ncbi:matrix protein [hymenopteran rhabdo-related virus 38]|uniref:Matrix protein n=1 Tax=hymenopteran rhabdo-related virus 38 TaxID=2847806 RepID=A0A7D7EY62_9RHAB|nr:matrix protein [hymenopteran rhabdo-related virus 38]QMP82237.1 matrix protein [hymenopteran rhabdo-related virus 38]
MLSQIKKFVSRRQIPSEEEEFATRLYKPDSDVPLYPFEMDLSGRMRIDGPFRVDWMKDTIKKLSVIIAYHAVSDSNQWEDISPYIASGMQHHLIKTRMFSTLKDQRIARGLYCPINYRAMSLLSHVSPDAPALVRTISHRWDLITPQREAITVSYRLTVILSPYDFELRDDKIADGVIPLEIPSNKWIRLCAFIHSRFSDQMFSPSEALESLVGEVGGLKKLLGLSLRSHAREDSPLKVSRRSYPAPLPSSPAYFTSPAARGDSPPDYSWISDGYSCTSFR